MKRIIYLTIMIALCLCNDAFSQSVDASQCDQEVWPRCGAYEAIPGGSSSDCCEFLVENNILPEESDRMNKGEYSWRGTLHTIPRDVEILGPCCILQYIKGNPCTISPYDVCNIMEQAPATVRSDYQQTVCNEDPIGKQDGDYFVVERCGKIWRWKIAYPAAPKGVVCNNSSIVRTESICEGEFYPWEWSDQPLSEQGHYKQEVMDKNGCITTYVLDLNVSKPKFVSNEIDAIVGESVPVAGLSVTRDTTITQIFTSSEKCDSTVYTIIKFEDPPTDKCRDCKEWYTSLGNFEMRVFGAYGNLPRNTSLDLGSSSPIVWGAELGFWQDIDALSGSCSQSELGLKAGIASQKNEYAHPEECDCFNYDPGSNIHLYLEPAYRWNYTGWCESGIVPSFGASTRFSYNNSGYNVSNWSIIPKLNFGLRKYFQTSEKYRAKVDGSRKTAKAEHTTTAFLGVFTETHHTALIPTFMIGLEGGIRFGFGSRKAAQEEAVEKLESPSEEEERQELLKLLEGN